MSEIKILSKAEVVQALREADCRQVTTVMCDGYGGYCALGVIAKAAGFSDDHMRGSDEQEERLYATLCQILEPMDLDLHNIWMLNDTDGRSFRQIADYIEKETIDVRTM